MSNDSAFDIAFTSATTSPGVFPAEEQSMRYNAFDKVTSITEGDKTLQITYGHHRQRIGQQFTAAGSTTYKVYVGACEYITKRGETTIHTYLSGPEGLFAVVVQEPKGTAYIRYIHTDHLGSWNTITDAGGNRLQEINFDAWGNRRDPNTWRAFASTPPEPLFDRGFTGHEHLYGFQLINMNGRMGVYPERHSLFGNPVVSRMLSPDNFVQAPDFSQSFNRYSYAWNNPLVLTDPSGEIVGFLIAGAIIGAYIGGAIAEGEANPGKWAWNNNTWKGIIAGGLIGTATGGVIGAMWSAGATISIGANLFGNSVPLISFSKAGFSTANTVAGLIGIGGLGAAGVASIDYSSLNTNKALNEMQSRESLYNQSIASWNSSVNNAIDFHAVSSLSFEQARFWYKFGGGDPLNVNLNTIDFSRVSMSEMNDKLIEVNLDNPLKHYTNANDALVYGTLYLYQEKGNVFRAAHINEINGRGDYYNFDVKWTSPKAWLSGRNENTIIGGLINGLMPTGGSFMYVGGTPYPIYLHGTVEIKP